MERKDFFDLAAELAKKRLEELNPGTGFCSSIFKALFMCEGIDFTIAFLGPIQRDCTSKQTQRKVRNTPEEVAVKLAVKLAETRLKRAGLSHICDTKTLKKLFKENDVDLAYEYNSYVYPVENFVNEFDKMVLKNKYKGGNKNGN